MLSCSIPILHAIYLSCQVFGEAMHFDTPAWLRLTVQLYEHGYKSSGATALVLHAHASCNGYKHAHAADLICLRC